jgi:Secretion system C-terminal sorting domain
MDRASTSFPVPILPALVMTAILLCVIIPAGNIFAQPADSLVIGAERVCLEIEGDSVAVPYVTSEAFDGQILPHIDRVILAIHEGDRDAVDASLHVNEAVNAFEAVDRVLTVCPQFLDPYQRMENLWLDSGVLAWGDNWFYNGSSVNPSFPAVGTYAFVDRLVELIVAACPNLEVLVFTGHAGGGKFVHRYAMASSIEDSYTDIEFLYQFGNSGGYAYLNAERYDELTDTFLTPDTGLDTTGCSGYDRWPFGLTNVVDADQFQNRYQNRNLIMMVGVQDTELRNPICQMIFQTPSENRLEMADLYWEHTQRFYGEVPASHVYTKLGSVDHDIEPFYQHSITRYYLLDFLQNHGVHVFTDPDSVVIPADGGMLNVGMVLANSYFEQLTLDAWSEVERPGGIVHGPLEQHTVSLQPAEIMRQENFWHQIIPAYAPAGEYFYYTHIGTFPDSIVATSRVTFSKAEEFVEPVRIGTHPNPFNPSTTIRVALPEAAELNVTVYNVMGQQVATLADGRINAGTHSFTFDASDLASGLYFVRATVPGHLNVIQKIMLVR